MKNPTILLFSLLLSFAFVEAAPQSVKTTKPVVRSINRETRQPAQLLALNSADIGTRVSGYIQQIQVDIGDTVSAGDVLAIIDAPELAAQKRIALAEKERHSLQVQSARANLNAAKAEDDRIQKLVASQSLSEKVSLESKSNFAAARATLSSIEAEEEIASARLQAAEAFLGFTVLRAPFDGVVAGRFVDVGDQVTADGSTLFVVEDSSTLRLVAYVPERDAVHVDVGDAVVVKLDALPGKTIKTRISRMSNTVGQGEAHRMRVEAEIKNADLSLQTGLYGSATIALENRDRAVLVPAGAVRFGDEPLCVYVVEDGTLRHRAITLGLDDGQWLEVVSGLKGDESLVIDLLGRLTDGTPVSAK